MRQYDLQFDRARHMKNKKVVEQLSLTELTNCLDCILYLLERQLDTDLLLLTCEVELLKRKKQVADVLGIVGGHDDNS